MMLNEQSLIQQPTDTKIARYGGYRRRVLSFMLLAIVCTMVLQYPIAPLWLAGFLLCYGCLLHRYPATWLFFIPALLPIMDFTAWTGRFFCDEFDLLVLTTVAVQLWQVPQKQAQALFSKTTRLLFWLYCLCYGISLLRGLLPLQAVDANAFSNYYSNYNSLRVGKGLLWGILLLPALKYACQNTPQAMLYWAYGVLSGLTGVIIIAVVERALFTGVFDFSSHYRINALFSSMHTGGGHIESYLMLSLPFIAVLFFNSSASFISIFCGISLFVAGLYVLLVTFSRGGYIGFAVGFVVLIASLAFRHKDTLKLNGKLLTRIILPLLMVPIIVIPVFKGQLIQQRFSIFSEDKAIRTNHWLDAVNMMDNNLATYLLGMGIGSYPRTYFWLNTENVVPATYKIENQSGNQYLRLRGGDALFMGQYVSVAPKTQYQIQADVRSKVDNAELSVSICEKSLIYSLRCANSGLHIKASPNDTTWQHIEQLIDTGEVGAKSANIAAGLLTRPVQLALYNANKTGTVIDTDNIKLLDSHGKNQLVNGDFSADTDRWLFATEKHHPWHILNLWVQVLFDQGLLGLVLGVTLILLSLHNSYKKLKYNSFAAIFLSAVCGFIIVGWVDSPFDAPRITLLFFLTLVFSVANVNLCSALDFSKK
ncbi:O-antigen ligase family protein [Crenothrix sp.]|uniref:O-antigen ligase family protein n=1 Tax=Crenothrix sp. TaxID=3100433 RepID=UPI00374D3680